MTDIEEQLELEADALHNGAIRCCQGLPYQPLANSEPGRILLGHSIQATADEVLKEQLALKSSARRKLPRYGLPLLSLISEKFALITIGTMFNEIARSLYAEGIPPGVTSLANIIGRNCWNQRILDIRRGRAVDIARELLSRNQSGHAERRAREQARKADDADYWSTNRCSFHLGHKLIVLAVRSARFKGEPIFEFTTLADYDGEAFDTMQRVTFSAIADQWIAAHRSELVALATPIFLPMVVPPRPWTSPYEGGYLDTPVNLLKRKPSEPAKQMLAKADLSVVYSVANALQNTAWRLNRPVLGVMKAASDAGHLLFGLPRHTVEPLPPRLPDDADPEQIRKRNRERAEAFKLNNRIKGHNNTMASLLAVAERLVDKPQIFFPHQYDHRGRAYPMPQLISPQSDDTARALLEFAEGKPLGEHGAVRLAIHIANCYMKGRKVSFAERRAWVRKHEQEILAFAANPDPEHRLWKEADSRWMFFAACLEWRGYREQGPNFVSHLPISVDGSCNGYQHLSAMGRDPIGGRATNLMPFEDPQDIYQDVSDRASLRLQRDAETPGSDQESARQLVGKLNRDVVKPATMTIPYGVTRRTIAKELREKELVASCKDPKKSANYLAKVLMETVPEIAVEAGKIMDWARDLTRVLAKANRWMAWTTPTGFCVFHAAREEKAVRLATLEGTFVIYEEDESLRIDVRKQVDGIVAHLVHSYDAAHMMRTVHRLHADGLRHFAMVHDSFGVHACDVDTLDRVLREEFVRIHSEPVLQNFLDGLRKANPDLDLLDLPKLGNLDIRQVIKSLYFFA